MKRGIYILIAVVLLSAETISVIAGTIKTYDFYKVIGNKSEFIEKIVGIVGNWVGFDKIWIEKYKNQYGVYGIDIDWKQVKKGEKIKYPTSPYIYFERFEEGKWQITSNFIENDGRISGLTQEIEDLYKGKNISDKEASLSFFKKAQRYALGQISSDYYYKCHGVVPKTMEVEHIGDEDSKEFYIRIYVMEDGQKYLKDKYHIDLSARKAQDGKGTPIEFFIY